MVVFKEGDQTYHSKVLSFYRKEPFELEATYLHPDQIPYPDPLIGRQRGTLNSTQSRVGWWKEGRVGGCVGGC